MLVYSMYCREQETWPLSHRLLSPLARDTASSCSHRGFSEFDMLLQARRTAIAGGGGGIDLPTLEPPFVYAAGLLASAVPQLRWTLRTLGASAGYAKLPGAQR
jgi:hypothetical protein